MIVNVGLLVHHKINLQNSVDLAAYYGAMRQAEMLNAMSHVNYQIRQSWKLAAWRYRMFGAGGDRTDGNPYDFDGSKAIRPGLETLEGEHPAGAKSAFFESLHFASITFRCGGIGGIRLLLHKTYVVN